MNETADDPADDPASLAGPPREEQLRAYVQHKKDCSLVKPKVFRSGFHLEEVDGEITSIDDTVQIDGPGDECTCGLASLLAAAPSSAEGTQTTLAEFAKRRDSLHATFNGGWHDEPGHRAFHHGMDTVFNCIDAELRGERRQA